MLTKKEIKTMKRLYLLLIAMAVIGTLLVGCGTSETNQPNNDQEGTGSGDTKFDLETTLDVEQSNDVLTFEISLANKGTEDVELMFTSSQIFEIYVKNSAGDIVYTYSADKMFMQAIEYELVKAGDTVKWEEHWNFTEYTPNFESGEYTVEVEILGTLEEVEVEGLSNMLKTSKEVTIE